MDIPRLGKPSFTKLTGSKLTGWHFTILSVVAFVVLAAIFLQTTGSDMEFPKVAHKTSQYTAMMALCRYWIEMSFSDSLSLRE